jgi:HSP20 family protein
MAENTVAKTDTELTPSEERAVAETRDEQRYLSPPVDILETEDGLAVVADLPGVSREGLDVSVDDDILTIKGRNATSATGEALRAEFELLDYYRQFRLGEQIDQERITAELKHGVLHVGLPRVPKATPRQIQVNVN